ncbi:undecaprenyl-diphosphatase [bacterium]|nr:undecaprenyl-diphosphatase [bacterium]NIN93045.1 undecaprenyl-diphosphatase [bacterium]NIO18914.1 undecaprenyl-diphosphatase [bacterium]NIO73995.1 undecaprenyl-diphosphatase [bacterium]
MSLARAVILGLVQGLTEFLPISSSAHLVYFQKYLGIDKPQLSFTVFLHFATLLAIIVFFRKDLWEIFKGFLNAKRPKTNPSPRILFLLVIGSLPIAILGILLKDKIELIFSNIEVVSLFLILTGILLYLGDRIRNVHKDVLGTGIVDALIIGMAQAAAILPGISRSGATIIFALFCGLQRKWAVKYSFFLAVPAILGATLIKLPNVLSTLNFSTLTFYIVGAVAAFLSGYWALTVVLRFVQKSRLRYFAYYCVTLGLVVLFFHIW